MSDLIDFDGQDIDGDQPQMSCIKIRQVREVTSIDSLANNFKKELKKLALDDLIGPDVTLVSMLAYISRMRPNTIILRRNLYGSQNYFVIDADLMLRDFIAMRKNKVIATGDYKTCASGILYQLRKDFPDKFTTTKAEVIDDEWLKNVSMVHYNNDRIYKIINLK